MKKIVGFILSIVILLIILYIIGVKKVINVLLKVNLTFVFIAILMELVVILIMTLRWKYVLKVLDYSPSIKNLFLLVLLGQFINNITPSMRGGGEPFRAYYLYKLENIPKGVAFSSVLVERVLDTIIFLFMTITVIAHFITCGFEYTNYLIFSWIFIFITSFFLFYIILNKNLLIKMALKVNKFIEKFKKNKYNEDKILNSIEEFYSSLKMFKKSKKDGNVIIAIILSFLWYILDILKLWILFLAIPYYISIINVASVYLVTLLSGIFSPTPSGFGTSDIVMIGAFSLLNTNPSVATVITLLDRFISYILPTIFGYLASLYIYKKAGERYYGK
ncbi:hypothetical protein J422_02824 [Methanocaldococcus villosus KIN24-T80]|uniref:Uncharacterized protein n=1 Tax=Methanocaldococcus villosus KIN24-T80 TaxID=1069083 RepID=N6V267_9EURY|nr:UPF0104 family protein [Methanocaldococcus villosus]ENN96373.1 hypothetical protein J422_02824 [Methanocaldococcus villosus KIN24-T80]